MGCGSCGSGSDLTGFTEIFLNFVLDDKRSPIIKTLKLVTILQINIIQIYDNTGKFRRLEINLVSD